MNAFFEELARQRWDDHRFYHHCRINQSLHLFSACCFVLAYLLLPFEPAWSAIIAWCLSMTSRQAGHFFFEPKGYDHVNQATHEYKERIKVGYNLRRKVVLMAIWAASPLIVLVDPTVFGVLGTVEGDPEYLRRIGTIWLAIGVGGLILRVLHLFVIRDVQTGFVWAAKILTDPLHDVKLYYRAPIFLMRGQLIDPMHTNHR